MASRSPSILFRTIWLHALALGGIAVAISAAAYLLLNYTANEFEARLLRDGAANAAQGLSFGAGRWRLQLPPDLQAVYARGFGGYSLNVSDEGGALIYASPRAEIAPIADRRRPGELIRERRGASAYYALAMPIREAGHTAWVEVSQNLEHPDVIVDDVVAGFLVRFLIFAAPISLAVIVIDVVLMRRILAPVIAASGVVQQLRPSRSTRLPTAGLPREILPLAQAVNGAFDRLEQALQAQRDFAADAAHELRTPLSVLRTHVDVALEPAAASGLRSDIEAMSRIVDQLLQLAELEGFAAGDAERADLVAACKDVVRMVAPLAAAAGRTLLGPEQTEPLWVSGNAETIQRAVRNLVDNAIAYGAPGSAVEVEVAPPGNVLVKDRGDGVRPEERPHIFKRFWRSERQNKGHAGLGLAIVARTVQLYGGTVAYSDREGGGSVFSLCFQPRSKRP